MGFTDRRVSFLWSVSSSPRSRPLLCLQRTPLRVDEWATLFKCARRRSSRFTPPPHLSRPAQQLLSHPSRPDLPPLPPASPTVQSEVAELAEKRRKEELARKSEVLRGNLAVQVQAKERLKQVEKDAVKTLAREQEEDLRKFKAEATARQALDRQRTAQLRVDRSAQLAEKAARAAEEEKQRKREEDEFKRAMLREHVATIRAEEAARAKQKCGCRPQRP